MNVSCLILNRLPPVAKKILLQNTGKCLRQPIIRNAHSNYLYRKYPPLESEKNKFTVFIGSLTWWWILWHLFTDYGELLGYSYPDPSKWTNEELGIPED